MKHLLRILAPLALVLGTLLALPQSAQAAHWVGPRWNPAQPVITLSDRTSYDFQEYESGYAWGSLAADNMSIAYTTLTSCTGCIMIYAGDLVSPRAGQAQMTSVNGYTTKCVITIDRDVASRSAAFRQAVVTHEIGHCLGFGHSSLTSDIMYPTVDGSPYKPSSHEYATLDAKYS